MTRTSFFEVFGLLYKAFGRWKWRLLFLTLLGFVSGILEGIGINAVIPLFSVLISNQFDAADKISQFVVWFFSLIHLQFSLPLLLGFIALLFIVRALVLLLFSSIRIRMAVDYRTEVLSELLHSVLHASWPFLLRQKLGHIQDTFIRDVHKSFDLFKLLGQLILSVTGVIMYLFVAMNISQNITFLTLAVGALFLLLLQPLSRRTKEVSEKVSGFEKELSQHLSENLIGVKTVKTTASETVIIKKGQEYFKTLRRLYVRSHFLTSLGSSFVQPLSFVYIALVFAYFYKTPSFNLAAFTVTMYLIQRIFVYLQNGQSALQSIYEFVPYTANLLKFRELLEQHQEHNITTTARLFSFKHSISFRDVWFSYQKGTQVLSGVSFTIARGEVVGLIGSSGAGKTSIADLLVSLFNPEKGGIYFDDIKSSEINTYDLRKNIGYVSQDLFLLNDTIANNIKFYDPSISDADMVQAAKDANIYAFTQGLKDGFDTFVGDRGVMLSGGQRQRVVLARVLARRPSLLVLDEATSALDNESELLIQKAIHSLKGRASVLIIAHRLSTVMDADTLLVLESGKIVETGTPQELLQNKKSYFYRLYHLKN